MQNVSKRLASDANVCGARVAMPSVPKVAQNITPVGFVDPDHACEGRRDYGVLHVQHNGSLHPIECGDHWDVIQERLDGLKGLSAKERISLVNDMEREFLRHFDRTCNKTRTPGRKFKFRCPPYKWIILRERCDYNARSY